MVHTAQECSFLPLSNICTFLEIVCPHRPRRRLLKLVINCAAWKFLGKMTGCICHIKSSGLAKSCWYLHHFWTDSHLVTGSCTNLFQGTAVTDYMECSGLNVTRWVIPCTLRRSGLICSALDRELQAGESGQDPNEGEKWKFNELGLETFRVMSAGFLHF